MRNKNSFFKKNRSVPLALAIIAALLVFTGVLAAGEILDPNFGTNGIVTTSFGGISDRTNHILLQTDGKIIVSGYYQTSTPFIARYHNNGTVDTSFGTNGSMSPQIITFTVSRVAIQSDGKLVVAGSSNGSFAVARYNSNGTSLDTTFGTNGVAIIPSDPGDSRWVCSDLAIQSDSKIVVVGTQTIGNFTNFAIARFNSDGTPDPTFVANGINIIDKFYFPNNRYNNGKAVVIQPDGKIVMSGWMMDDDGNGQISLARLNPDGSLDTTAFGTNGKGTVTAPLSNFYHSSGALTLQTDGKIVVAGTTYDDYNNINENLAVARFNGDGSLDTAFGGTGIVITDLGNNEIGNDFVLQPDGKIILIGKIYDSNFSDLLLVRYNSDGSLDNTFGVNGKIINDFGNFPDSGNGVAMQSNGMIVVAGSSNGKALLARYILDASNHQQIAASFKSTGAYDGWVLESGENTNSGGLFDRLATTFNVGDDARDRQYRGFLSFNTASIPDNAVITSVHLDIKRQGIIGTDPFTTHGDLLLDIRSGTFSNNPALQLADFNAPATLGASQERFIPLTFSWYTAQFNSANLRFINRFGLTQIRLLFTLDDNDDMGADIIKFFSGNSTAANQPQLIIQYYLP
jgi:uncharacterized delta-60 repeat protein